MESVFVKNISATSISINEYNNASDNATIETPQRGFFITPSVVDGRPNDITGYLVSAMSEQGKLGFISPDSLEPNVDIKEEVTQDLITDTINLNIKNGSIKLATLSLVPYEGTTITLNNSFITENSLIFLSVNNYTGVYGNNALVTYCQPPTLGQVQITLFNDNPLRSLNGTFTIKFLIL